MADIDALEQTWKSGMGKVISDATLAIINADEAAKDAGMARTLSLIHREDFKFVAKTSIIGMEQGLQTGIIVPAIVAGLTTNIGIKTADLKLAMDVKQHEERATHIEADSTTEASAKFGFFGQGGRVKTTATLGVTNDRKRSSDYRSTVEVNVHMEQLEPAEGLMLIINALTRNAERGLDINSQLVDKQAAQLADKVDQVDTLPDAPDDDRGGDANAPAA